VVSYEYTMGKTLDLKAEQEKTLMRSKLPANLILQLMFWQFDVLYGKARSLPKVMVLEILARYPYWAWENGRIIFCRNFTATQKKFPQKKWRWRFVISKWAANRRIMSSGTCCFGRTFAIRKGSSSAGFGIS